MVLLLLELVVVELLLVAVPSWGRHRGWVLDLLRRPTLKTPGSSRPRRLTDR